MKILQINAVYGYSSTGRTTLDLHRDLIAGHHQSYVITSIDNKEFIDKEVYYLNKRIEKNIHSFLSKLTGLQGYYSYFSTKRIIKKIDFIKPDIVHLRNLHANFINIPLLLKYLAKKDLGVVVTLHDCWYFTGKCCYYTEDNCIKWQNKCGNCPALKKWNKSWFFDFSAKMLADKKRLFSNIKKLAVIGVSDWITNEAKSSILCNAKIIVRIYNWIDFDIFNTRDSTELRNKYGLTKKFIVLGIAQKWTETKGLQVFLEIAKRLDNDESIILVGEVEDEQALPANVFHFPATSDAIKLAFYYSMADVMLNPSIQETFGKVTVEALACGTPVIVNNATANPELVGDRCGIVINNNSIDEIYQAVKTIKAKGKESFSKSCVDFAQKKFNKRILIAEYVYLYQNLLSNKA
jgi:glycosyltransferase involved in cell wall biosynthesis